MHIDLSTSIDLSDKDNPRKGEYVDEYELRNQAKEVMFSKLVDIAIRYAKTMNTDEIQNFVGRMQWNLPRRPEPSWNERAEEAAKDFIKEYILDEIIEQLIEDGEIGEDIRNDFRDGDSGFHESVVDKDYDLQEAAELLSDLSHYLEEDSGLWQGQDPERAIATQAAFTYGNAVYSEASDILEKIRDEIDMEEMDVEIKDKMMTTYIKDDMIENKLNPEDDDEAIEWIKEQYESEFKEKLEAKLKKAVEEIIDE